MQMCGECCCVEGYGVTDCDQGLVVEVLVEVVS